MPSTRLASFLALVFAVAAPFVSPHRACGQFVVDCSGNTPGAYTTINSVIPLLSNWSTVQVSGTCQENVWISGIDNLWIGSPSGAANLQGSLGVNASHNLVIQGLNVTNSSGTGISVSNGSSVELDNCTSSNNSGAGLIVADSVVSVQNGGAFNNNGNDGIQVSGASDLGLGTWLGPGAITVSNNVGDGIYLEDGVMLADGGVTISNNKAAPGYNAVGSGGAGYGINVWGHGRGFILSSWAPDTISGNQTGGIAVHESSEFVLGAVPYTTGLTTGISVSGNGPVGVSVGLGSQVSLWSGVEITGHSDAGVEAWAHSQVIIYGPEQQGGTFQISGNGTGPASSYPTRAGVRVDGNSEAYIRSGQIAQNGGPGILVLANSSVDLSGTSLASNSGGPIACDTSAWLVTDSATVPSAFGAAAPCKIPNSYGPSHRTLQLQIPQIPGLDQLKLQEQTYWGLTTPF